MTYVANPSDPSVPLDGDDASGGAAELRALKGYIQGLISGGSSFKGYAWQGFRNKLINGNFDLWRKGIGTAGPGVLNSVLADGWRDQSNGTNITPSQQFFALGQTAVPYEPAIFHRTVVASVANVNNFATMTQRVEGVRTFAGQQSTLSFYAKADAARPMAIEFFQEFGVGGSPNPTIVGIGVQKINLTTSWQLFTFQGTMPSIAGKTIGTTANTDFVGITLWFDAGANFNSRTNSLGQQSGTFDIAQVQWEPGGSQTPFELLPPEIQEIRAARFLPAWNSVDGAGLGTIYVQAANTVMATIPHTVKTRAAPNAVNISSGGTGLNLSVGGIGAVSSGVSVNANTSNRESVLAITTGTALTLGQAGIVAFNGAGVLYMTGAEP